MSDETTHEQPPSNPEIHFEPLVSLPKLDIKPQEENEEEIFQIRAKLYRYTIDKEQEENEWKERGVGVLRILKHKEKNAYRILMRRDKTLKICANHLITTDMELKPNCGSDRAWVWSVAAEFADEKCQSETLAAKFANAENAQKFKDKFEECQKLISEDKTNKDDEQESDKLAKELESLNVKESEDKEKEDKKDAPSEASTSAVKEPEVKDEKKKDEEDVPEK